MPLVKCPDCGNQISDSALTCIHCGRPMKASKDKIMAEIMIKLQELQSLEQQKQDDIDFSESNPDAPWPSWLDNYDKRIRELQAEIDNMKKKL